MGRVSPRPRSRQQAPGRTGLQQSTPECTSPAPGPGCRLAACGEACAAGGQPTCAGCAGKQPRQRLQQLALTRRLAQTPKHPARGSASQGTNPWIGRHRPLMVGLMVGTSPWAETPLLLCLPEERQTCSAGLHPCSRGIQSAAGARTQGLAWHASSPPREGAQPSGGGPKQAAGACSMAGQQHGGHGEHLPSCLSC